MLIQMNVFLSSIDAGNDSYSVSQTQTINFTQQTLRQRQTPQQANPQAPPSQSQQHSQMGMQMNMAAQNPGRLPSKLSHFYPFITFFR